MSLGYVSSRDLSALANILNMFNIKLKVERELYPHEIKFIQRLVENYPELLPILGSYNFEIAARTNTISYSPELVLYFNNPELSLLTVRVLTHPRRVLAEGVLPIFFVCPIVHGLANINEKPLTRIETLEDYLRQITCYLLTNEQVKNSLLTLPSEIREVASTYLKIVKDYINEVLGKPLKPEIMLQIEELPNKSKLIVLKQYNMKEGKFQPSKFRITQLKDKMSKLAENTSLPILVAATKDYADIFPLEELETGRLCINFYIGATEPLPSIKIFALPISQILNKVQRQLLNIANLFNYLEALRVHQIYTHLVNKAVITHRPEVGLYFAHKLGIPRREIKTISTILEALSKVYG